MNEILSQLLGMFLGLVMLAIGILMLRDGKITRKKRIPSVYLDGFRGLWFGQGNVAYPTYPAFYLKNNIQIISGNGTIENPFQLAI